MNEREQNWRSIIANWQRSDLSGAAFCREQGLVYYQFQYWRQKYRQIDEELGQQQTTSRQLVPVQLTHRSVAQEEAPLQLQLPNGIIIRDVTLSNVDTVSQLLMRL